MSNISIPNTFSAFTVALSADVNANFTEIATKFNTYAVQKDVDATITAVHTYSTAPVFGFATASQALELNSSKAVQSVAITGTGNYVKSASPTFTGTIIAAAATLSSTLTVNARIIAGTDTSTSGSVVLQGVYSSGASAVWGTEQSSGGPVSGYAVRPDTSAPDAFLSTVPTSNLPRGAYTIAGQEHKWFCGAAQIVAVDSAVTVTKAMQLSSSNLNVLVPLIVEKDSAEVDIFLRRTGTNALDVYLYNTGVGAGYYDGTNLRTVWNYNPATAFFTFGVSTLDVSDSIAQARVSPTSGFYTGSAFQSLVTRAASTAYDHFYATANGVVVARIRGDGSALFAQGLTVTAGGASIGGGGSVTGTWAVTGTLTATTGLTVSGGGAAITGNSTVAGTITGTTTDPGQDGAIRSAMTLATATASSRSGFASVVSVTHTTGTVSLVAGNVSNVTVSGSGGTTTDALGLATIVNRSNGSITNARGLYVIGLPTTGVTNNYGIYVAAISGASSVNYAIYTAGGQINFQGLPVSSAGLAAGTLWNNSGVINVA